MAHENVVQKHLQNVFWRVFSDSSIKSKNTPVEWPGDGVGFPILLLLETHFLEVTTGNYLFLVKNHFFTKNNKYTIFCKKIEIYNNL